MTMISYDPATLAYHELRAPLGLMLTAAQSAAEECEDATVRHRCEAIVRTADRMLRVAEQMLRVHAAKAEAPELYLPGAVVTEVVRDLAGLGMPVAIVRNTAGTALRAAGSMVAFESLVNSLINNASDHASKGTPVSVSLTKEGDYLRVEIENEIDETGAHQGVGAGRYIEAQLAAELGAGVFSRTEEGSFTAIILLPVGDPLSS